MRVLLENGADRAAPAEDGTTAMQLATDAGHDEVVAILAGPKKEHVPYPWTVEDARFLLEKLEEKNIEIVPLEIFDASVLVSTYYVLAMAETASNLARLDGMNYGGRMEADGLKDTYALTRSERFTPETKRRIIGGNQILSQGHSEEIYQKATVLRERIIANFEHDFSTVDLILSPVSPGLPPEITPLS